MGGTQNVYEVIKLYQGDSALWVLFLIAYIYIFINQKHINRSRGILLAGLSVILVFNPVFYSITGAFTGTEVYYRFIWAVPVLYVIAKAVIDLMYRIRDKATRVVVGLILILMMFMGRSTTPGLTNITTYGNIYNIPDEVIEVAEIITEDTTKENPVIIADTDIMVSIRCYDPRFVWGISRKMYQQAVLGNWYTEDETALHMLLLRVAILGAQEDVELVKRILAVKTVDYMIMRHEYASDDYMKQIGYVEIGKTETRTIYGISK